MDRTAACGAADVGSIPTGSTADRTIPLERDFLHCAGRSVVPLVSGTARQGRAATCATAQVERLTTGHNKTCSIEKRSRSLMDRISPSEGGDAGSIPAGSTRKQHVQNQQVAWSSPVEAFVAELEIASSHPLLGYWNSRPTLGTVCRPEALEPDIRCK